MKKNEGYEKIEKALQYLERAKREGKEDPSLEQLAKAANLSPTHFQKVFTRWVGLSPKQFMQYLKHSRAKAVLDTQKLPLTLASYHAGLSGSGRLHDLFVRIERMTPGEYAQGGAKLAIQYSFQDSRFGRYIVASTERGVCWLRFITGTESGEMQLLKAQWPKATYEKRESASHKMVRRFFDHTLKEGESIPLLLRGTPFQVKVWEALLRIPEGKFVAYADVAKASGKPRAVRAAASAVGDNPLCYIIPCHRVIRGTGAIGNYSAGPARKLALLGFEASKDDRATLES